MGESFYRLPDEFSLEEWQEFKRWFPRATIECNGPRFEPCQQRGFRCACCQRTCCACVGGSERDADDLCAECANEQVATDA